MKLSDVLGRYLEEILITKSRNHQVMSSQELEYWRSKLGKTPSGNPRALSSITPSMIRENLPQNVGPATKNRYLSTLSAFFNVCIIDWELVKVNPVSKVRKYQEPRGRVRYLSDDERSRLLESLRPFAGRMYLVKGLAVSDFRQCTVDKKTGHTVNIFGRLWI